MWWQLPSSKPYQHKELQSLTLGLWWRQAQGASFGVAAAVLKANTRASSQHVGFHFVLYGFVRQRHKQISEDSFTENIPVLLILIQMIDDLVSKRFLLTDIFFQVFVSVTQCERQTKFCLNAGKTINRDSLQFTFQTLQMIKGTEFVQPSHHGLLSGQLLGSTISGSTVKSLVKWMTGRALKCTTHRQHAEISLQRN